MAKELQFEIAFCEGILRRAPDLPEALELLAGYYTQVGRIDDGLALDRRLVSLAPSNPTHHYNLACSLALKGRLADALAALRRSIQLGYSDFQWMREDPDLESLRPDPRFRALLEEITQTDAS